MSMFTGLKAVNHFGRPDMSSFLKFVQKKHSYVSLSILFIAVIYHTWFSIDGDGDDIYNNNNNITGKQDWSIQLWTKAADKERYDSVRRSK